MKTQLSISVHTSRRAKFVSMFSLGCALASVAGGGELAKLTITPEKGDLSQVFELSWEAVPNTLYRVQRTTNLSSVNLGNNQNWLFGDAVVADTTNAQVEIQGGATAEFFRLEANPEVFSLEPTWVNSGDSNAVLYILGQMLPTNASVVINGHTQSVSVINTGGVWAAVSLNGLPPGEPWFGDLLVIDNGTGNVVANYKLQSGFIYATAPQAQQRYGPPEEPPASPAAAPAGRISANDKRTAAAEAANSRAINRCWVSECTGEVQSEETDLAITGRGLDFTWTRTYRSQTGPDTAMGHGWDFSYNVSLTAQPDGTVQICMGNGRCDTFYPNGTNGWARDEYFVEVRDLDGDGMPDVLFADGGKWLFNPNNAGDPSSGKLRKIITRNGDTMTLGYDTSGRLVSIVDTLNRTNIISYSTLSGQLESVTDFSGRIVRYEYDTHGDLVACVSPAVTGTPTGNDFPGGKTNRYSYTSGDTDERLNHNLISVTDPKGQTWLQVVYQPTNNPASPDFDVALALVRGGTYQEYLTRVPQKPSPANQFAVMKCIMSDAVGNVTESFYDSRQRCVRRLEYTGRCNPDLAVTESSNRPAGKLREGDPDFYEAQWTWNPDSLCTGATALGDGNGRINRVRMVYGRDIGWLSNGRKKGDLYVVRELPCCGPVDMDGDGVAETSELVWHFDYDPNFGSPPAGLAAGEIKIRHKGWDGLIYHRIRPRGWDGTIKGLVDEGNPDTAGGIRPRGWDGTIKGLVDEGNPDTAGRIRPRGWDGTIKGLVDEGNPDSAGRIRPRGWDGTIKGRFAAGPRQSTSLDGTYAPDTAEVRIRPRGWDGTIKGRFAAGPRQSTSLDGSYAQAADLKVRGADGANLLLGRSESDFATSVTDPRGVVTSSSYDGNGNLVSRVVVPVLPAGQPAAGPPQVDFTYNTHGQVTSITNAPDANGYRRVDTFTYYTNGPQAGYCQSFTVDRAGQALITATYEYDARGNVTRVVDPRGNDSLYAYNQLDELVRCQSPPNVATRCTSDFVYDASGNVQDAIEELRDGSDALVRNVTTHRDFDLLDRCTVLAEQVSPGVFVTNRYFYDGNDGLLLLQSPLAASGADPHAAVAYEYDERGLLFHEIGAPGSGSSPTNEYTYDVNGNPTLKLGTANNGIERSRNSCTYDGFGRPATMTDAMSNVVTCVYDRNDNLVYTRIDGELNDGPGGSGNQRLYECRYRFDSLERLTQSSASFFDPLTQAPIGDGLSVDLFTYAPNSQLTSATDDNSHITRYTYDTAGRVSQITDPKSNLIQITYDAGDNLLSMTSVERSDLTPGLQQFSRTYAYDSWDRCVLTADNVGNSNLVSYDSLSRVVRATDPNGNATFYQYDDLSRRTLAVADINRDGIPDVVVDVKYAWTYDDNSHLVSTTDNNSNATFYAYDSLDRRIAITNADGTTHKLIWSPRSNLVGEEDANGTVISNRYDALDRLIARDITPGPTISATTTFERYAYDGLSRCVAATNDVSYSTFDYNSLGGMSGNHRDGWNVAMAYDGVGNRLSMTYPSGRVVTYTYNALDEVASVTAPLADGAPPVLVSTFAYEGPGRVGRITRANGVNTRIFWDGLANPGNVPGDFGWRQVRGVNHQVAGGGATIDSRVSIYDGNQNRTVRAQNVPFGALGLMQTNIFSYDPLDRLTNSSTTYFSTVAQTYQLDGSGNRVTIISNGLAQPYLRDNTPRPGPADFQMDQYTLTPAGAQSYDDNGNLVSRASSAGQLQFYYDYADRLVAVQDLSSGLPTMLASYSYDALSRRISKTSYPPKPAPPVTTVYINDPNDDDCNGGGKILETRNDTAYRDFVVIPDRARGRMMQVVSVSGSGQPQYYHEDDLGTVLALTDGSGVPLERYDYQDYGAPTFLTSDGLPMGTNASPAGNPFLFQAMFWEPEMQFYFKEFSPAEEQLKGNPRHRPAHYDPQNGRFVDGRYLLRAGVPLRFDAAGTYANDNPWSLKKEEGGRHTPFHNRYQPNSYFEKGDKPTQAQFGALIDSSLNLLDDRYLLGLRTCPGGGHVWPTGGYWSGKVPRNILKTYFETGEVPTQEQFKVRPGVKVWCPSQLSN